MATRSRSMRSNSTDRSSDNVEVPRHKYACVDVIRTVRDVDYNIPQISVFSLQLKQVVCSTWSNTKSSTQRFHA